MVSTLKNKDLVTQCSFQKVWKILLLKNQYLEIFDCLDPIKALLALDELSIGTRYFYYLLLSMGEKKIKIAIPAR